MDRFYKIPHITKKGKYVKSHTDALKLANEPLFSHLSELDCDDVFDEVQICKRTHNHTIRIYLGIITSRMEIQSFPSYSHV